MLLTHQMLLANLVLLLPRRTLLHGNLVRFGIRSNPTAETPAHAHQVFVIQLLIRTRQLLPPITKPSRGHAYAEVGVQHDAIHAIVAPCQRNSGLECWVEEEPARQSLKLQAPPVRI